MDIGGYSIYFCCPKLLFKGRHALRRSLADDAHMVFYRMAVNIVRSEEAGADAAIELLAVADGAGVLIDSLSSCYGLHPLMPGGFRAFPFFVRRRLKYLLHLQLFFILRLLRPACGLRKKQVQVKQPKADESQEQDGHAEGHPFFAFLAFLYAVEFIHCSAPWYLRSIFRTTATALPSFTPTWSARSIFNPHPSSGTSVPRPCPSSFAGSNGP